MLTFSKITFEILKDREMWLHWTVTYMGCHYRQSNIVYGAFVFINGAFVFVNGAFNFANGAPIFLLFFLNATSLLTLNAINAML